MCGDLKRAAFFFLLCGVILMIMGLAGDHLNFHSYGYQDPQEEVWRKRVVDVHTRVLQAVREGKSVEEVNSIAHEASIVDNEWLEYVRSKEKTR